MRDRDRDDDKLEWYLIALIAIVSLAIGPVLLLLAPHVALVSK